MAKLYSNGEIGSYRKVADKINNESEMDFEISIRQVEKLITESKMYKRRRSSGQVQLAYFVRKNIDDNIIEDRKLPKRNSYRRDVDARDSCYYILSD